MNLNDYIALSSERPNRAVLQGLGASEELIEYLMETPNNTNWNVVGSLSGSESDSNIMNIYFSNILELITDLEEVGISNPTPKEIYDFCELHNTGELQPLQATDVVIYIIPPWPIESPTSYNLTKDGLNRWGITELGYYWFVDSDGTIEWGSDN